MVVQLKYGCATELIIDGRTSAYIISPGCKKENGLYTSIDAHALIKYIRMGYEAAQRGEKLEVKVV